MRHSCTATRAGFALDETLLTDPDPAHLMGVLMGLDNLFIVAADPMYPTTDRVVLSMRLHYRRTGQFNLSEPGMVVPRRADRSRPHATADELSQVFKTLRISPEFKDSCAWVRVDELHDHIPGIPGLQISQVPLALKEDVESREVETPGGIAAYELVPKSSLHHRIPVAARAMAGADLGITAEATLDTQGVEVWRSTSSSDSPTWILAGTGPVDLPSAPGASASGDRLQLSDGTDIPVNRAVLIHGRSGEVVAVADKVRGYHIAGPDLGTYGMASGSPPEGRAEAIRTGRRTVILESTAGRFAILICEDLDRLLEIGPSLHQAGVSHILNPVIAPEILPFRWQQLAGRVFNKDVGTALITTNSLAIDRIVTHEKGHQEGAPTLLVVTGTDAKGAHLINNPKALSQTPAEDAVTPRKYTIHTAPMP